MRHGACKASMRREANDEVMECQSKGDTGLRELPEDAAGTIGKRQGETNAPKTLMLTP